MAKKQKSFMGKVFYWLLFGVFVYFGVGALSYADTLRFAHISDVHISDKTVDTSFKLLSHSEELFEDEIKQINGISNLDFVIMTGDLADKPQKPLLSKACDIMNRVKYPWYFTFGNHDAAVGSSFKKNEYFKYILNHNKAMKKIAPENFYYSFVPKKGYRLIALDATIDTKITGNGIISKEQLDWLDNELKEATIHNELPIMFLHHPVREPMSSYHHRLINAKEVYEVLNRHDIPMAIFSGHYHTTKIIKENNILHVSTPSLVSYPNAFRVVTVNNMKTKVVFNFEFKETNYKDLQKKAKLLAFSSPILIGEESDRNTIVILEK